MEYNKLFAIILGIITVAICADATVALNWLHLVAIPTGAFTALFLWHKDKPHDWKRPKRQNKQ